uniref:Uncharacterized protein n=1 Tax=Streptomyces sp. SoC090715LN-17 TaxID=1898652 RepID=A0A1L7NQB5_9ACTN|nr:hypothetical protein [Streptomyces sp. SoC090715LN-17]
MRFTSAVAASVIALGAVLSGLTAAAGTDAPQVAQHRAVASDLPADAVLVQPDSDHGNG